MFMITFLSFPDDVLAIRNAPITSASSKSSCQNNQIVIPLLVNGFTSITAMSLRLEYINSVMTFVGGVANPLLSGVMFYASPVSGSNTLYKVMIVWTDISPKTLNPTDTLAKLTFNFISGNTGLDFNNTVNGGADCEYADENGIAMTDVPTENFYYNGLIIDVSVPPAGPVSGSSVVCQGNTGIIYSIAPLPNATGYTWTLPPGATPTSGSNTNSITVDFASNASSGNISVFGSNSCGNGIPSPDFPVTVDPFPGAAGPINGPESVCAGAQGISYSVDPIANATSYNWTLPPGAIIAGGAGTNNITVDFSESAASGNITVWGTNSCGNGASSSKYIWIDPLPGAAGQITGNTMICKPQTGVTYSVNAIPYATGYSWSVPPGATITGGSNTNVITVDFDITSQSGVVTVFGTNSCGNGTVSPDFPVTVNDIPPTPSITLFEPDSLVSSSPEGNQWYFDDVPIPGATGPYHLVIFTGYYSTVVTLEGCVSAMSDHLYVIATGIGELTATSFSLYPNPTSENFTMELIGMDLIIPVHITVYSIRGEKIIEQTITGSRKHEFSLSGNPSGLYFVKVASAEFVEVIKVVKR